MVWWFWHPAQLFPDIEDDFNRPSTDDGGTLGVTSSGSAPWFDYDNAYRIRFGQAESITTSYAIADVDVGSADSEVSADFDAVIAQNPRFGVTARHSGAGAGFYCAYISAPDSTIYLFRSNPNGGNFVIWSETIELTDRVYRIGLRTEEVDNETRITALLDGQEMHTYMDDRFDRASGNRFGIRVNRTASGVTIDNFTTSVL